MTSLAKWQSSPELKDSISEVVFSAGTSLNCKGDNILRNYVKVCLPDESTVSLCKWLHSRGEMMGGRELIGRWFWIYWFDEFDTATEKLGTWFHARIAGK